MYIWVLQLSSTIMESRKNKINHLLLSEIDVKNHTKLKSTLDALAVSGTKEILPTLVQLMNSDDIEATENKMIGEFLATIKDESAIEEFISMIQDENFIQHKRILLTAMWNSTLDFSWYIDVIVKNAVEGSMIDALDCLTIIENMEGPFIESKILEAKLILIDYLENQPTMDEQKQSFLQSIALKLKTIQIELDSEE